jgi:hypothetical protein
MGLFSIFGNKQTKGIDCMQVAGNISGLLWTLINTDPTSLANPYVRIVLRKDGSVFVAGDKRDPKYLLGWGDVSFAFVREDSAALAKWVEELKINTDSPPFQQIATEEFAKSLTRLLMRTGHSA